MKLEIGVESTSHRQCSAVGTATRNLVTHSKCSDAQACLMQQATQLTPLMAQAASRCIVAPKPSKGKGMASSSHGSKRLTRTNKEEHDDLSLPQQPLRQIGLHWVMKQEGKKWFKEHKESKYSHEMFIDRETLALKFPRIVDRLYTLGLVFVYNDPGECNLNMLREFLSNWDPKERSNQVKIRGQIVNFSLVVLNRIHGSPRIDPQLFKNFILRPPYREIQHTLGVSNTIARWAHHQQDGYHVSFPYAHMPREARVWLKIISACLMSGKHVTHETRCHDPSIGPDRDTE
ncbi:hypothetical protein HAX54_039644 [Datura stramonium]|uniref:Putative plant transposon protein domain-containing protein n=1 Tax=Datura stramonium TaxID=4076 RepID=A0ABS8VLM7_DATST|nr:hypothetical protein [Datura stramonium]